MKFFIILSACPTQRSAHQLARLLVRKKLAACINIIPGIQSYFWWKGKVDKAREFLLIIKTKRECFEDITKVLQKTHPYEIPEIIGFPLEKGFRKYLRWLEDSLAL